MSKEKKEDREFEELQRESKQLSQKRIKFKANCVHVHKNGRPSLVPLAAWRKNANKSEEEKKRMEGMHICERCETIIDVRKFLVNPQAGLQEFKDAIAVVLNGANVIKHRAAMDVDNKRSDSIISFASEIELKLPYLTEMLEAIMKNAGGGKKKEKRERHRQLRLGLASMEFTGGGEKKKKKNKW